MSSLALAAPALAQSYLVWTGLGPSSQWTSAANWQGGVAPANDGTAALQFGLSNRTLVTVDAAQDVWGLTFDYPVTNDLTYRLSGSATTLSLGAGGLLTTNAAPVGSPPAPGSVNSATPGTTPFRVRSASC